MQCSSGGSGTEAHRTWSPTNVDENCPNGSISGPSSRRQAPVESGSLPQNCNPMPEVSKSLEELTREVARVRGQPAGKEEDRKTSNENGPLLVPKCARVVFGRRHHRLRVLVDHWMCRDGRSEESLLERRGGRTLAARQNYQTALVSFLNFVQKRQRLLSPGSSASPWFTASCYCDGSLAVIQPLWVQQSHASAFPSSDASTCMGRHRGTSHPSQPTSNASFHSHLTSNLRASVRASHTLHIMTIAVSVERAGFVTKHERKNGACCEAETLFARAGMVVCATRARC